ncbi:hypothetical protein MN116_001184 [Schistosoma mekongi]|uniref:Haloacid dehalogenase-like hydrolase domain-containing protein n=1 Tax=Schistosoma mekongi TaxID=38744 RepID=A0AAE2DA72_SCHME|nr:hypothetical protein MN116_001184 [Schistosoma mekongi]
MAQGRFLKTMLTSCHRFFHAYHLNASQTHSYGFKTPFNIIQCSVKEIDLVYPSAYLVSSKRPLFKSVIFDKDGTLVCFNSMWMPWAKNIANNISCEIAQNIESEILTTLGCCPKTHIINPGVLAEGTKEQIIIILTDLLVSHGIPRSMAQIIVGRHVQVPTLVPDQIVQLHDLKSMFTTLKEHSVMTAICTSDSRKETIHALRVLDISHLVDIIVCGDDPGRLPKPHPDNAKFICEKLHVLPEETVMVGDTSTDVAFAKNANLGLCVGVLSGIGQQGDLKATWLNKSNNGANNNHSKNQLHIVPSVAHIMPLILADNKLSIKQAILSNNKLYKKLTNQKFKLVIIDKDGSFVNVHPRWAKWCENIYTRLTDKASPNLANTFLNVLGYSSETRKISNGILSEGSMLFIEECLRCLLILKGYGIKGSDQIVKQVWICPSTIPSIIIPNTLEIVNKLLEIGVEVAINTSDSRDSCDKFLSSVNLHGHIKITMSSEDAGRHPKPLPHTVLQIIDKAGCKPEETVVVGDTPADLISGQSAKVGLTVGILSGFSSASDLTPYSDLLLPNLSYLPNLFTINE